MVSASVSVYILQNNKAAEFDQKQSTVPNSLFPTVTIVQKPFSNLECIQILLHISTLNQRVLINCWVYSLKRCV